MKKIVIMFLLAAASALAQNTGGGQSGTGAGGGTVTSIGNGTGTNVTGTATVPVVNLNAALPSNETATTQATADNTNSVATDAYVKNQGYGPGTIIGTLPTAAEGEIPYASGTLNQALASPRKTTCDPWTLGLTAGSDYGAAIASCIGQAITEGSPVADASGFPQKWYCNSAMLPLGTAWNGVLIIPQSIIFYNGNPTSCALPIPAHVHVVGYGWTTASGGDYTAGTGTHFEPCNSTLTAAGDYTTYCASTPNVPAAATGDNNSDFVPVSCFTNSATGCVSGNTGAQTATGTGFDASVENIDFGCGMIANAYGFANYYFQEGAVMRHVQVSNCGAAASVGFDIGGSYGGAQNGSLYDLRSSIFANSVSTAASAVPFRISTQNGSNGNPTLFERFSSINNDTNGVKPNYCLEYASGVNAGFTTIGFHFENCTYGMVQGISTIGGVDVGETANGLLDMSADCGPGVTTACFRIFNGTIGTGTASVTNATFLSDRMSNNTTTNLLMDDNNKTIARTTTKSLGFYQTNSAKAVVFDSTQQNTIPINGAQVPTSAALISTNAAQQFVAAAAPTAPITVSATGGIACATCVTSASSLTSTALMTGAGSQVSQTPSATSTLSAGGALSVAAGGSVGSADTGTPKFTFGSSLMTANQPVAFTPTARSSGVLPYWQLTIPTDTGLTAATEAPGIQGVTATRTWATTGTIALQREIFFPGPTYASAGASQTFTDVFNMYLTPPVAGSNAIFTREHTLGIVDSTAAASAITGALVVATTLGTALTSVGIGGGSVNAGSNVSAGGTLQGGQLNISAGKLTVNASGLPTNSNNIALAGQGYPLIVGITSQKSETTTADANVLTVTPPAAVGSYELCTSISVSAATSGVIGWTATWKDSNANAQAPTELPLFQTSTSGAGGAAAPALTFTTSVPSNYQGCASIDIDSSATAIVIKWIGGGTTTAKMSAWIKRII